MSATTRTAHLEEVIRNEIPNLSPDWVVELARIVAILVESFQPERIYVFGSQARGDATADSDVDLLMVVTDDPEPRYRRAQAAYRAVGRHRIPFDIIVMTRHEFNDRRANPATLPGIVLREGRALYTA